MARWMIIIGWVVFLALMTLLFSRWIAHRENPNQKLVLATPSSGEAYVELKRNPSGHYLASGEVNSVPVRFMLDTGATYVAVPESVAAKAGLKKGVEMQSMTANGLSRSWFTLIDEVQLGPIVMRDVRASILPNMGDEDVLLGMSFLKHLRLEQEGDSLRIAVPE